MARVKPFRRLEIDAGICTKISRIIEEERYRGSFTSRVESILDDFAEGYLKDVRDIQPETTKSEKIAIAAAAERLRKHNEQRKAS